MNYYVGLDNGGTTTKAAIFDAKGKEIATASTATKMLVPQPGFTERDMEEMREANCLVIREALKKSGAAPMVHGFLISALVVLVALAVEYFMGILPF